MKRKELKIRLHNGPRGWQTSGELNGMTFYSPTRSTKDEATAIGTDFAQSLWRVAVFEVDDSWTPVDDAHIDTRDHSAKGESGTQ